MGLLGRAEPIRPHVTIPRDWSGSVPASPLLPGRTRFGSTAPTPPEYGVGAPLTPTITRPAAAVAVVLIPALFGSMAATPYQFGIGQPLLAYIRIPKDWSASVPSSPLFKARHGFSADTPIQFGVGQPLPVVAVFPRDWSTSVPTSPPRFGTWGLSPTLPTYGQPIAPEITIPAALTAAILNAVRYGVTIDPGPPPGYGQPLAPDITIPVAPALITAILEAVRYGATTDPGAPLGYGQPLAAHIVSPRDWASTVPASPLRPTRFGTWGLADTLPTYGQPLAPDITIPGAPGLVVSLLQAVRYGLTAELLPGQFGYGQPLEPLIPLAPSPVIVILPGKRFGLTADLVPPQFGVGQPLAPHTFIQRVVPLFVAAPDLAAVLVTSATFDGRALTAALTDGGSITVATADGRVVTLTLVDGQLVTVAVTDGRGRTI